MKDIDQDLPRRELFEGHRSTVPVYVDDENVAKITGCRLVAVDLSVCKLNEWFTAIHRHETDEIYVCVDSAGAVAADIEIDEVITTVRSPFVVRIRAGQGHRFRPTRIPTRAAYILGIFPANRK